MTTIADFTVETNDGKPLDLTAKMDRVVCLHEGLLE